jgi:hypothetical protein
LHNLNIGRIRYEIDDPRVADLTNNLALVNGLAERSGGFVWRYVDESGNATDMRPYADPRTIINFSVWENIAALERFVWQTSASTAAAPSGSSISKGHRSCCGGCPSAIGRASSRLSPASSI